MSHAISRVLHRPAPGYPFPAGAAPRFWGWLLSCLLLAVLAPALCPTPTLAEELRVAKVLDGDTLRLTDGRTLRLAGIDTPEQGRGTQPDQFHARESTALARRLAHDARITLRPVSGGPDNSTDGGTGARDKYARLLGEAILPDGSSLNERMVAEGAAWVYWHKGLNGAFLQRLLAVQREAIRQERGMWRGLLRHEAARKAYVGNSASRRFFPADSAEAQRVRGNRRAVFSSLAAAFEAGYAPGRTRIPDAPHLPPRSQFLP